MFAFEQGLLAPCSEREFLLRGQRRGVINVTCIKVWEEADQTLLFFRPDLLGGDKLVGTNRDLYARSRNRQ